MAKSALVFVKLSENQVGEYDLLLTPRLALFEGGQFSLEVVNVTGDGGLNASSLSALAGRAFLNESWIAAQLAGDKEEVRGTAPRWTVLAQALNRDDPQRNQSVVLLVIDSEREREIGLGRDWELRALGEQECYASASLLRALGVRPNAGERLRVRVQFAEAALRLGLQDAYEAFLVDALASALLSSNLTLDAGQVNVRVLLEQLGIDPDSLPVPLPQPNTSVVLRPGEFLSRAAAEELARQLLVPLQPVLDQTLSPTAELIVVDEVDEPRGKWPAALGNVIVLEKRWVPRLLASLLPTNPILSDALLRSFGVPAAGNNDTAPTTAAQLVESLRLEEYALLVSVQYARRFEAYVEDQKGLNRHMIRFTNLVAERLGVDYPAQFELPLLTALQGMYFVRLFLDQIFLSVLVILVLLGVLLIYSLLLSDVEEKTYELGMLRALGLRHRSLVELLLLQAFFYSAPAIAVGFVLALLLFQPVASLLSEYAAHPVSHALTAEAVWLGLALGLGMPQVANLAPIQRALGRSLRDSLDLYHQVVSETSVRVVRLESLGLSVWQVALSVLLVVIGFVVYYLIPLSFTFNNLPLFFGILTFILLGMLLGASAVASTLQPLLERAALKALLAWGPDRKLESLVRKALAGHRRRNRKTALMFTMSLAFVIFSGAMFSLQAASLEDSVRSGLGADLVLLAPAWDEALAEAEMRALLEREREAGRVRAYAFASFPLDMAAGLGNTRLANLAGFPEVGFSLVALEREYLDAAYTRYYVPEELDPAFEYELTAPPQRRDLVRSLYDDAGQARLPEERSGLFVPPEVTSNREGPAGERARSANETYLEYVDVLVSEALRDGASIAVGTPLRLTVEVDLGKFRDTQLVYLAKPRGLVSKLPGYFFSSYKQTAFFTTACVTMDWYSRFLRDAFAVRRAEFAARGENLTAEEEPPAQPPKQKLLVRMTDGASREDREAVLNGLRNFIPDSTTLVVDTRELLDTTHVGTSILVLFFNIVAAIAVFLCFFMLFLSFTANVRENAWELGVLRALGLSAWQVVRAYIYEALAIILASVLLGAIIGLLIAVTLTLQFNLFSEMPFRFEVGDSLLFVFAVTTTTTTLRRVFFFFWGKGLTFIAVPHRTFLLRLWHEHRSGDPRLLSARPHSDPKADRHSAQRQLIHRVWRSRTYLSILIAVNISWRRGGCVVGVYAQGGRAESPGKTLESEYFIVRRAHQGTQSIQGPAFCCYFF